MLSSHPAIHQIERLSRLTLTEFQKKFGEQPTESGVIYGLRTWTVEIQERVVLKPRFLKAREYTAKAPPTAQELIDDMPVLTKTEEFAVLKGLFGREWSPGANRAKCLASKVRHVRDGSTDIEMVSAHEATTDPDCGCGIYAYFTDNIYDLCVSGPVNVAGIIKGYGATAIGPRGFRSSRAEILAMWPFAISQFPIAAGYRVHFPLQSAIVTPPSLGVVRLLEKSYPEVAIFSSPSTMMSEFPTSDPPPLSEEKGKPSQ